MTEVKVIDEDHFELALRILGVELLAFKLSSKSDIKNWFVLGILSFTVVIAVLSNYLPSLLAMIQT